MLSIPGGGDSNPLAQPHPWRVAQVPPGLLDRDPVASSVEADTVPGRGGLPSITAERADAFGHPTGRQKRPIRHVSARGHASKFLADGAEQLGLRERLVVTDVVSLPEGPVAVERKQ